MGIGDFLFITFLTQVLFTAPGRRGSVRRCPKHTIPKRKNAKRRTVFAADKNPRPAGRSLPAAERKDAGDWSSADVRRSPQSGARPASSDKTLVSGRISVREVRSQWFAQEPLGGPGLQIGGQARLRPPSHKKSGARPRARHPRQGAGPPGNGFKRKSFQKRTGLGVFPDPD